MRKIVYYDSLSDDFANINVDTKKVKKDFKFINKNPLWRFFSFLLYYFIAIPVVFLYTWLILGLRIHNFRAMRSVRGRGFFLYGNHTNYLDVFIPPLLAFPHRVYTVASPDAVSIKGLKTIVLMLGGMPVPVDISALGGFTKAVRKRCNDGSGIVIYPEAKIWPYYNGIRPFPDSSFKYPADLRVPVIAMFTAYRERRGLLGALLPPGWDIYLSDPFYPDTTLPPKLMRKDLHDKVYSFMKDCSQLSDFEYVAYRPASMYSEHNAEEYEYEEHHEAEQDEKHAKNVI